MNTCPSTVIARISSPDWCWRATRFGVRWKQSGTRGRTPDLTTWKLQKNTIFWLVFISVKVYISIIKFRVADNKLELKHVIAYCSVSSNTNKDFTTIIRYLQLISGQNSDVVWDEETSAFRISGWSCAGGGSIRIFLFLLAGVERKLDQRLIAVDLKCKRYCQLV